MGRQQFDNQRSSLIANALADDRFAGCGFLTSTRDPGATVLKFSNQQPTEGASIMKRHTMETIPGREIIKSHGLVRFQTWNWKSFGWVDQKIIDQAESVGADAIVGYRMIHAVNSSGHQMLIVYGTAVSTRAV